MTGIPVTNFAPPRPATLNLAGKMGRSARGWRSRILLPDIGWDKITNLNRALSFDFEHPGLGAVVWPIVYAGPFEISEEGMAGHGEGEHASGFYDDSDHGGNQAFDSYARKQYPGLSVPDALRRLVFDQCRARIQQSNIVLAYLTEGTEYGTLVEIGIAHALGKFVWVGMSPDLDNKEFWFAQAAAHGVTVGSAKDALFHALLEAASSGYVATPEPADA